MHLTIESDVLSPTPGMRIVGTSVTGIDNSSGNAEVDLLLTESWDAAHALQKSYPSPQTHPRVGPWRDALRTLGISPKKFSCSIESMLRRAYKSCEPLRINPLTDYLHAMSLRHLVPLGGFDAKAINGSLELRRTRAGDTFQALDSSEAIEVEVGEIAYAWEQHVLTRHFVWRQSAHALLTSDTTDAIIVVEVLPTIDRPSTELFVTELADGLHRYFGNTVHPYVLDSGSSTDLAS